MTSNTINCGSNHKLENHLIDQRCAGSFERISAKPSDPYLDRTAMPVTGNADLMEPRSPGSVMARIEAPALAPIPADIHVAPAAHSISAAVRIAAEKNWQAKERMNETMRLNLLTEKFSQNSEERI